VEVRTFKRVTIYDGANAPRGVTTTALIAADFLREQDLDLGPDDAVEGGLDMDLTDGAEVYITRTDFVVVTVEEIVDPPVEEVDDLELPAGQRVLADRGLPGTELVTYRITRRNGVEADRVRLSAQVVTPPEPKIVKVGAPEPDVDDSPWDDLGQDEVAGSWVGECDLYYGDLRFDSETWHAYGDNGQIVDHASRQEQLAIAEKFLRERPPVDQTWN
jgi:resuscitation-promoting factor RpfB